MPKRNKEFWITNTSTRDVSLADLNVTVRSFASINLLDPRHYQLTEAQIQNSVTSGSIFKKRDKIKLRVSAPAVTQTVKIITQETAMPSRARSGIPKLVPQFDEIDPTDEEALIEELSESAIEDHKPRHSR